VRWSNYLVAAGGLVGMHVENSDETVLTRYFHKDHLGSIAVITNESGTVLERLSYDAWGKRRYADGSDDPAGVIASQTNRGFTGHEELDAVGLVHMNGRVYDPLLARFGTADPTTESPFSTQGWNRYSYVGNSPLNFTDPSGYCFLGCFWKPIFAGIQNLFRSVPILGAIVQIAAGALCGPICVGIASAVITGITSGNLGLALKAGFISAVTAFAFTAVGDLTSGFSGAPNGGHMPLDFGSDAHLFNIAGHALVGCASAVASGNKCGPGALAGAVTSFAGPLINGRTFSVQSLVANATLGGLASVAGGGKFANGALTGAFGYLFNAAAHPPPPTGGQSQIPEGPWTWSDDPNNSRGGKYWDAEGRSASWDDPGGHWDVDDGQGNRQRYNRWGIELTPDEAHGNYNGPPRTPLPRWNVSPWSLVPSPCVIAPQLCMPPDRG
jgi:RHS repeat-associated protein